MPTLSPAAARLLRRLAGRIRFHQMRLPRDMADDVAQEAKAAFLAAMGARRKPLEAVQAAEAAMARMEYAEGSFEARMNSPEMLRDVLPTTSTPETDRETREGAWAEDALATLPQDQRAVAESQFVADETLAGGAARLRLTVWGVRTRTEKATLGLQKAAVGLDREDRIECSPTTHAALRILQFIYSDEIGRIEIPSELDLVLTSLNGDYIVRRQKTPNPCYHRFERGTEESKRLRAAVRAIMEAECAARKKHSARRRTARRPRHDST